MAPGGRGPAGGPPPARGLSAGRRPRPGGRRGRVRPARHLQGGGAGRGLPRRRDLGGSRLPHGRPGATPWPPCRARTYRGRIYARYVARRGGAVVGRAYVDTHVVRTKRESLLISVDPERPGPPRRRHRVPRASGVRGARALAAAVRPPAARRRSRDPARDPADRGGHADEPRGQRGRAPGAGSRSGAAGRGASPVIAALERWARVPRVERWFFNAMHAAITLSGVAYFCMKYLMTTDDPFALINHPWEPAMLSIHVMAAPLVVVLFGMAFRSHTLRKLLQASPVNRRSGLTSAATFLVMTLSGYLIQVATSSRPDRGRHLDPRGDERPVRRRLRGPPRHRLPGRGRRRPSACLVGACAAERALQQPGGRRLPDAPVGARQRDVSRRSPGRRGGGCAPTRGGGAPAHGPKRTAKSRRCCTLPSMRSSAPASRVIDARRLVTTCPPCSTATTLRPVRDPISVAASVFPRRERGRGSAKRSTPSPEDDQLVPLDEREHRLGAEGRVAEHEVGAGAMDRLQVLFVGDAAHDAQVRLQTPAVDGEVDVHRIVVRREQHLCGAGEARPGSARRGRWRRPRTPRRRLLPSALAPAGPGRARAPAFPFA